MSHALYAFAEPNSQKNLNKSVSCLRLIEGDDASALESLFEAQLFEGTASAFPLILIPHEGFLGVRSLERIHAWPTPATVLVMTEVEKVIPALDAFCNHIEAAPFVFLLGASLMPTKNELTQSLFSPAERNLRPKALLKLFVSLRQRNFARKIDLVFVDFEESLGQKNSALLRRLFSTEGSM